MGMFRMGGAREWGPGWGKDQKGIRWPSRNRGCLLGRAGPMLRRPGCSACSPTPPGSPTSGRPELTSEFMPPRKSNPWPFIFLCSSSSLEIPLCDEFHSLKTRFQGHLLAKPSSDSGTSPLSPQREPLFLNSETLSFSYAQVLARA